MHNSIIISFVNGLNTDSPMSRRKTYGKILMMVRQVRGRGLRSAKKGVRGIVGIARATTAETHSHAIVAGRLARATGFGNVRAHGRDTPPAQTRTTLAHTGTCTRTLEHTRWSSDVGLRQPSTGYRVSADVYRGIITVVAVTAQAGRSFHRVQYVHYIGIYDRYLYHVQYGSEVQYRHHP